MIKTICLDIDGVITDLLKSVAVLFEKDYNELMANWPLGNHKIEDGLGISRSAFYKKLDSAGEDFWCNLEMFPWSMDLIEHCNKIAKVVFLTKPTLHPSCAAGKIRWFHKHFGYEKQNYIITALKDECSKEGKILIDDWETNITAFNGEGGTGILFPTLTNRNYALANKCFEYTLEELEKLR